jgi:hypothetical protein
LIIAVSPSQCPPNKLPDQIQYSPLSLNTLPSTPRFQLYSFTTLEATTAISAQQHSLGMTASVNMVDYDWWKDKSARQKHSEEARLWQNLV